MDTDNEASSLDPIWLDTKRPIITHHKQVSHSIVSIVNAAVSYRQWFGFHRI